MPEKALFDGNGILFAYLITLFKITRKGDRNRPEKRYPE